MCICIWEHNKAAFCSCSHERHWKINKKWPIKGLSSGQRTLLPDSSVGSGWAQLRFWIRAERAPCRFPACLHDWTATEPNCTHVHSRPHLTHQTVHPELQLRPRKTSVELRCLYLAQMDRDVQDWVEAMETLLHVAVLGGPVVHSQSILCETKRRLFFHKDAKGFTASKAKFYYYCIHRCT